MMGPVSLPDRFAILLRARLEAHARAAQTGQPALRETGAPQASLMVLAARAGADKKQLRRMMIEQMLTENFGSKLANEAGFQQVISRVAEAMEADPKLANQMETLLASLSA